MTTPTPAPQPDAETMATVHDLATQRLEALEVIEKQQRLISDIDTALAPLLPKLPGARYELPGCPGQGVRLEQPRRRFDEGKARAILTPTQYVAICVSKPSVTQARQVLGNALVDQLMSDGDRATIQGLRAPGRGR